MMHRIFLKGLTILLIIGLTAPLVQAAPTAQPTPPQIEERAEAAEWAQELAAGLAVSKIDPRLRDTAEQGGKEMIDLYVAVLEGTDLSQYMSRMIVRPVVFGGVQDVYGQTSADNLLKIAQDAGVVALVAIGGEMREKPYDPEEEDAPDWEPKLARLETLRANELTYAEASIRAGDLEPQGWFDVQDGHKSSEAWAKGFTGEGVVVGLMDDGIDFGHPDLQGTYATVTDPDSPYYGWPMAFSQLSMLYFANDVLAGTENIASDSAGSRWVDTSITATATGGTVSFQPLTADAPHDYTVPGTSQSGIYRLGTFHDRNLQQAYGERVAILVVDEDTAGVYDTIYVDLDGDYDFSDEKPATKSSPESYRDMDGDGLADISGGLLVWISDGEHTPPMADWLWGIECGDEVGDMKACPDSGALIQFAGALEIGDNHGTRCASNIAAQGIVASGLSAQPFRIGGMVQGGAPQVGLMDFGNHYFVGTDEDEYLVAALGYDGVPNTGDEVQVSSHSYGNPQQMWGSWGYFGRLVTALNTSVAPTSVWVFSSGNAGPGYGPQEGDGGPTTIQIGSSTQYGSTNWDSIASADQIVYGDPNAYYSHGPNRDGSIGVDVLANGGRGSGDLPINETGFNGAESWETWGGTSRSAPVAAGNIALIYQAYKARYGVWPTWDVVKPLVKSSADDSVGSPFLQGSGVLNADRATDLAAGIYGVYATPDEWQVGDWEGVEYLNFAKVAYPGDTYTKEYTVHNPSGHAITVGLSDGLMTLITKTTTSFTTSNQSLESGFNFHSPDYLMPLDDSLIPADADVMIVRYVHPYDTYDPAHDYSSNPNSSWRFLLYNWTDLNGDGMLWEDRDGNGVVNHAGNGQFDNDQFERLDFITTTTEIQQGEYIRVDYAFQGLSEPLFVRDPLERMADGYFFGWQHRFNDGTVPTTTIQIGLEFYKRADWDWLSLSDTSLTVPAEGSATFEAEMTIPASAAPGAYEGLVLLNDPGDENHAAHETAMPVIVNVIADLPDDGAIRLGGSPTMADTMYQNGWTYGYFKWTQDWQSGAGDWRHYFLDIDEADLANDNLLIHTSWVYTPTDINTWVLGPTDDCASNGAEPCAWYQPGMGQPNPAIFGPYTLQPIANTGFLAGGAEYPFDTTTGGPDDWLKAPLERTGLHEIALHNMLYAGEVLAEPFQVDVGTIQLDAAMDPQVGAVEMGSVDAVAFTETGAIQFQFTPTLELPDVEVILAGGLETEVSPQTPITVVQSEPVATFSPWLDYVVTDTFSLEDPGTTYLEVYLDCPTGNDDPDLFIIRDNNGDGRFTQDDGIFARDGGASGGGCSELVTVDNPPLGDYAIFVDGFTIGDQVPGVSTMPTYWEYTWVHPGDLPSDPVDVFSGTVTIDQDTPADPTTASFSTTVTAGERSGALHAALIDIPAGANVDLYVTDDSGTVVASSTAAGSADELVSLRPVEPDYRFEAGSEYTLWVHGFNVPAPVTPHLHVWWDQLNLWLSAEHADVHAASIGAGEMVSVTLHFDKAGWTPGDVDLSGRLLAGPSVMPNAFDELITIERIDQPPGAAAFSKSFVAERGASSYFHNGFPTALAQVGDMITFTLRIENTGDAPATYYAEDWLLPDWQIFDGFVVPPDNYGWYTASPFDVLWFTDTLGVGEALEVVYRVEADNPGGTLDFGWVIPNYFDVYDTNDLGYYYGGDINYIYYRSFRLTGSYKSAPATVLAGDGMTYHIHLANPSSEDRYIYVSDPLPEQVDFDSATGGATYDPGTHTVSWEGWLNGSALTSIDFDIQVMAKDTLTYSTMIQNQAVITSVQAPGGTLVLADTKLDATTMVGTDADLEIEKSVDAIEGAVDDVLNYTILFGNTGDETAVDVVMRDVLPSYLTVVTDSITATMPSAGALYDAGVLTWQGDLAPDEEVTLSFQAAINDTASENLALINLACVRATNFPWKQYNSALTEVLFGETYIYLPLVMRNF